MTAAARPLPARAAIPLAAILGVAGALFFYRAIWLSGFDLVFGDDGDARLASLLMEHWFRVFTGRAAFFSPPFFHPAPGVIGYTDANFLFGIVYSLGRLAGLSTYGAFQLVVVAWGAIGYGSMFWLTRFVLRCHLLVCLLWANLFAFSNVNAIQVGHMQLLVAAFVPLFAGLGLLALRRVRAGRGPGAPGVAVAVLFPLAMFTGFYVCWYAALFTLTALPVAAAVLAATGRGAVVRDTVRACWRQRLPLGGLLLLAGACAVPFGVAYAPQLLGNNGFTVDPLFLASFPHARDLVNVGPDNLVWGPLMSRMIPDMWTRLNGYELLMGVPPGFAVLFALLTAGALGWAWRGGPALPAVLAVATWAGLLLIVEVRGHSAWWLVRAAVPGARSLRVVSRYEVVLYATALMASAPVLSAVLRRRRAALVPALGLAAFLLAEQVQPTFARVSKSADLARLLPVPPPPAACRFFALDPSGAGDDREAAVRREQVDGIWEAMRFGLPTINGLSSLNPPQYWFYDLGKPLYPVEAGMWMARHGLEEGACTLNLAARAWAPLVRDPAPLPADTNLLDPPPALRTMAGGMRWAEDGFAGPMPTPWTGRDAGWRFLQPQRAGAVTVRFAVVNKEGADVALTVNGVPVQAGHLPPGGYEWKARPADPVATVRLRSSTFRPSADGVNTDGRDLGVLVTWLSLDGRP